MLLAALPEAGVEVSESKLVFARLPDVVHGVGQLPLPDLGQLLPAGWGQRAVVGVLGGTLCVVAGHQEEEREEEERVEERSSSATLVGVDGETGWR